jgi:hypothetical protein
MRGRSMVRGSLRLTLSVCLLIIVAGCGLRSRGDPPMSPTEVVNRFYRWHLGYTGNPLADKAYRTNTDLAESFIAEVDAMLASFELGAADPFLLAQDIPERFTVDRGVETDEEATVLLNLYWAGSTTPIQREVTLHLLDGRWQITEVKSVP